MPTQTDIDTTRPASTECPVGLSEEQHQSIIRDAEDFYRWRIEQARGRSSVKHGD